MQEILSCIPSKDYTKSVIPFKKKKCVMSHGQQVMNSAQKVTLLLYKNISLRHKLEIYSTACRQQGQYEGYRTIDASLNNKVKQTNFGM
jgi:hypothetical protein